MRLGKCVICISTFVADLRIVSSVLNPDRQLHDDYTSDP